MSKQFRCHQCFAHLGAEVLFQTCPVCGHPLEPWDVEALAARERKYRARGYDVAARRAAIIAAAQDERRARQAEVDSAVAVSHAIIDRPDEPTLDTTGWRTPVVWDTGYDRRNAPDAR